MTSLKLSTPLVGLVLAATAEDPLYQEMVKAIQVGSKGVGKSFTLEDDLLFVKGRWHVLSNKKLKNKILKDEHDSRVAGHFGQFKTLERIKANFYWPKMNQEVEEYVCSCDSCQPNKATRHKKYGLLDPLDIPNGPWDDISMDFIVGLPESGGHTKIWVVVDWCSKIAHFIPLSTDRPLKEIANIFLREIWLLHELPNSVVSDRDSRFQSKFSICVMELLDVDVRMSTAFHLKTDGQTERVNQILEQYLRSYSSYQQDDWAELLPLAEHDYNSAFSESTKVSPLRQTMVSVPVLTGWRQKRQSR